MCNFCRSSFLISSIFIWLLVDFAAIPPYFYLFYLNLFDKARNLSYNIIVKERKYIYDYNS